MKEDNKQTIRVSEDKDERVRSFHRSVLGLLSGHIYTTCQDNPQFHLEKVASMMVMLTIMMTVKVMNILSIGADCEDNDDQSSIEFGSLRLWRV